MPRKSPSFCWFWEFSNCLVDVDSCTPTHFFHVFVVRSFVAIFLCFFVTVLVILDQFFCISNRHLFSRSKLFWICEQFDSFLYINMPRTTLKPRSQCTVNYAPTIKIFSVCFVSYIWPDFCLKLIQLFTSAFLDEWSCFLKREINGFLLKFWISHRFRSIISSSFE